MRVTESNRSGSRAIGGVAQPRASEQEWQEARAAEEADLAQISPRPSAAAWVRLLVVVLLAGALPGVYPLSPGYGSDDTAAVIGAAVVASLVAVATVPLLAAEFWPRSARRDESSAVLVYGAALLSVGAAAIHFAVAKPHLEEYTLFGVFFVLSGVAQLGWAVLVLVRPLRWLLALGVAGNLAIAALWAVDRIWGLPLGPEHWKPEPVGFGDAAATGFELLLVLACVALLRRQRPIVPARRPSGRLLLLAAPVFALTALSLLSAMAIGSSVITPSA